LAHVQNFTLAPLLFVYCHSDGVTYTVGWTLKEVLSKDTRRPENRLRMIVLCSWNKHDTLRRPSWIVSMPAGRQNDVTTYVLNSPSHNLLNTSKSLTLR